MKSKEDRCEMADSQYVQDLIKEIEELKAENAELQKHVRPETLSLMKVTDPDRLLKKEKTIFIAKRILLSALIIICIVGISLLAISFADSIASPFVEDDSYKDESFIPDTTAGFNGTGSETGLSNIAEQGGYYYFREDDGIYKYANGEKTFLLPAAAEHINAYKYCVYYYDGEANAVCRVRTDGQDRRVLMENVTAADLKVHNDTVYVLTAEGDLVSVYINGKDGYTVKKGEKILSFTVTDGHIYYMKAENNETALYRMRMQGGDAVTVTKTDGEQVSAKYGYVFYIYNGTLYGFSTEKEKAFAFFAGDVQSFATFEDAVIVEAKGQVYAMDKTGGNIRLCKEESSALNGISAEELITLIRIGGDGNE